MINTVKIIMVVSFILSEVFALYLEYLDYSHTKAALPENVKDVYDECEYNKWLNYHHDNTRIGLISNGITQLLMLIFLMFNLYAVVFNLFEGINIYLQYFLTIVLFAVALLPISIPFAYYDTFVIEEKYGMNKTTRKTFVIDQIKSFVIGVVINAVLLFIVMFLFEKYGNSAIIWTVIVFFVISILINLIVMPLLKIFNKFEPLPDGELKDELLKLCEKYGVKVKKICVKDASRRTTKANAFCTGLTKKKVISLDDNLVNEYTTEQIVAVFAHEFAHAKYRHMAKSLPFAMFRTVITVVALGLVLNVGTLFSSFGFDGVNYMFAFTILTLITWPLETGLDIISNALSRKHEYQADAFAAREGYGEGLISALKKLCKDSLTNLNPHPLLVKLDYSHPTLSQRIDAIRQIKHI